MKKISLAVALILMFASAATAKDKGCNAVFHFKPCVSEAVVLTPEQITLSVQRAAEGVPALRSVMIDPDSFVLENVTLNAPDKKGVIDVCYRFRSHNRMGGYSGSMTARLNSKGVIDYITEAADASNEWDTLGNPCSLVQQSHDLSVLPQVQAAIKPQP